MLARKLQHKQKGVVLVIALIVLVAMTMAGIALVRSVDTSNIIAGNLAFQQSATLSGDVGTETAIRWLETNNSGTTLHNSITNNGYAAQRQDPTAGQSWDAFWGAVLSAQAVTLPEDTSGNIVSYAIQRLCVNTGDPTSPSTGCAVALSTSISKVGSSQDSGTVGLLYSSQRYYRITSRIAGPRNTVSYIQSIVAL